MTAPRAMVPADERLFGAIDAALRPAGVLSDLSRIIATFARPIRWSDSEHFRSDVEGRIVICDAPRRAAGKRDFFWTVSDTPIGQFPGPCQDDGKSDEKQTACSSLRVWTIRIDDTAKELCHLYVGICRPSTAPDYDRDSDRHSITVYTASGTVYSGLTEASVSLPYSPLREAAGSLYHFTADLSTGTLRVRPIIANVDPHYQPHDRARTEWTIAEGIADLAECRAAVCMASGTVRAVLTLH